jgi:hypothetical protein
MRYRATGAIGNSHLRHCRMCQNSAGNFFMALGSIARSELSLTRGEPCWFRSWSLVRRGFCSGRGTPLLYAVPEADFINISFGSLDEPGSVKSVAQSSTGRKMHRFSALDDLPREVKARATPRSTSIAASSLQHPDHDTETWPPETRQ